MAELEKRRGRSPSASMTRPPDRPLREPPRAPAARQYRIVDGRGARMKTLLVLRLLSPRVRSRPATCWSVGPAARTSATSAAGARGRPTSSASGGWKTALPVAVFDVLKGFLPVFLASGMLRAIPCFAALCGLAAVVGHCFPFAIGFRGGKGVATSLGAFAAIAGLRPAGQPRRLPRRRGPHPLRLARLDPGLPRLPGCVPGRRRGPKAVASVAGASPRLIVLRHRANIGRLFEGTETQARGEGVVKAAVIGGGSWGSAFARYLGSLGIPTRLWIREPDILREALTDRREHGLPARVQVPRARSASRTTSGRRPSSASSSSSPSRPSSAGPSTGGWPPSSARTRPSSA
ncbi:MAG: glycerol-3-phosphate acyltransferase [Candidatus Moduliflexus flocculans]|nr:glycerol-3-phosphate acyltransferase [Candidatus Moduliflexus flocculans]